ncbi:hypothetical protein [Sulfurovum sp. TSL1]|uniref:hypothetical protein n=1 Tax=Sulfurovum sp. TSL1 TaxID=2826994 RepID=UPI001CC61231|nr:hypothetical protein [Sulfurovum sp. TSL1]GIT98597.1 hypothetical protein TSL1_14180 [Sulfurovum sp. TSL1]
MKLEKANKVTDKELKKERRTFLKRALYKAPALIVLGSLAKPTIAAASCATDPFDCPINEPQNFG